MKCILALFVLGILALADEAFGGRMDLVASEVATVVSPSGDARVMIRVPLDTAGEELALARALLRIPATARESRGTLRLCVFPVTDDWGAGARWERWREGSDGYDRSRGSWVDADLRGAEIVLDVTNAVASALRFREPFEGLMICPPEGERAGFRSGELEGLQLGGATLEMTVRSVGPRPARALR